MAIRIACGSWADAEYTGVLYPRGLPAKERLAEYAAHFDLVEVNSSYYATPKRDTVTQWIKQTPPTFCFNIKLHRAFSQSPAKTAENGELVERLLEATEPLIETARLGTFLLVLPPTFGPEKRDLAELDAIAERLSGFRVAVELRDRAWITGKQKTATVAYFKSKGLVLASVDMPRIEGSMLLPAVDEVTNPALAYLRLHGRNKQWLEAESAAERHAYAYNSAEIAEIAKRVRKLAAQVKDVHVIANNHASDFAPKTALALREVLGA
jgi:uncharacterized protein YecE (DUF72 family)